MNYTPTPKTDAATKERDHWQVNDKLVLASFAGELERELQRTKIQRDNAITEVGRVANERDKLKSHIDELRKCVKDAQAERDEYRDECITERNERELATKHAQELQASIDSIEHKIHCEQFLQKRVDDLTKMHSFQEQRNRRLTIALDVLVERLNERRHEVV
jgi:chromosome segregation ATPase